VAAWLSLLAGAPLTARAGLPHADPSILTVRSCGKHRVIIQRICNRKHCRMNAFVQSGVGSAAARTYPIREVNEHVSAFVRAVDVEDSAGCVFLLAVDEPHTGDPLFKLRIQPRTNEGYDASKVQTPN
jgi:hypothetical protein